MTVTNGETPVATILNQALQAIVDDIPAVPSGIVRFTASATAPAGWLLCDGSAVSRSLYAELFAAIGTTWGAGDGVSTFNLPDARGRTPISAGTGAGLTARSVGQTTGAENHQLIVDELPAHTHLVYNTNTFGTVTGSAVVSPTGTTASGSTGGDQPHNNMQPSLVLTPIIKT